MAPVTIYTTIQQSMDATHWILLFLGWLMYWLNKMNAARKTANGGAWLKPFWADNGIEIPTSAISCLVLAIMSKSISTDLIDLRGIVAVFIAGYTSGSILNGLITNFKQPIKS